MSRREEGEGIVVITLAYIINGRSKLGRLGCATSNRHRSARRRARSKERSIDGWRMTVALRTLWLKSLLE